jgi:hypothetical protein
MSYITHINDITLTEITRVMRSYERVINWYNRRYAGETMPADVAKRYNAAISVWDQLKPKRDQLKAMELKALTT